MTPPRKRKPHLDALVIELLQAGLPAEMIRGHGDCAHRLLAAAFEDTPHPEANVEPARR